MVLEDHRANAGHYKCHYSADCASFVFQNLTEVTNHQQSIHGVITQSPVQQLQHQVIANVVEINEIYTTRNSVCRK